MQAAFTLSSALIEPTGPMDPLPAPAPQPRCGAAGICRLPGAASGNEAPGRIDGGAPAALNRSGRFERVVHSCRLNAGGMAVAHHRVPLERVWMHGLVRTAWNAKAAGTWPGRPMPMLQVAR
ncbi:MAG: hypothetical protein JNL87_02140 [Burkholderiaceae bacterium]|nr:hypothetical protein [Burkholderiaceae bacterium]